MRRESAKAARGYLRGVDSASRLGSEYGNVSAALGGVNRGSITNRKCSAQVAESVTESCYSVWGDGVD